MAKKIIDEHDELMKRIEGIDALDSLKKGYVEFIVRVPVGAVLTTDNAAISDSIGCLIEEELDRFYPDDDKLETAIGDNVSVSLLTKFE